jgi:hypothetical protein
MLTILRQAFRRTRQNWQIVLVLFLVNFCLGLILAFPTFNILQTESQNSLAFDNLIADFDFTVFSDFLRKSGKSLMPLLPIALFLTFVYTLLNIFFTGGILSQFTDRHTFSLNEFLKNSFRYFLRFFLLFLVQMLFFVIAFFVIIVVFGIFGAIGYGNTEPKFFAWLIPAILFAAFYITYLLNVGEYAKVILHKDDALNPWKAFWRASKYVNQNFKTMQVYWSVLLVSFLLLLLYLLLESSIGMTSGFTIWLMFLIQQIFVFCRTFVKVWNLSNAFDYLSLKPIPLINYQLSITNYQSGEVPLSKIDYQDNEENKLSE